MGLLVIHHSDVQVPARPGQEVGIDAVQVRTPVDLELGSPVLVAPSRGSESQSDPSDSWPVPKPASPRCRSGEYSPLPSHCLTWRRWASNSRSAVMAARAMFAATPFGYHIQNKRFSTPRAGRAASRPGIPRTGQPLDQGTPRLRFDEAMAVSSPPPGLAAPCGVDGAPNDP